MQSLRTLFKETPWLHGGGGLEIASGDAAANRRCRPRSKRLREWDYPVEVLTPAQLAALEPDLDLVRASMTR